MMKLYSFPNAPNPRRVHIFAAEKGIELDIINVDLLAGEIKKPEFLKKNSSGKIPVLELDDGQCISESVAICRYLETIVQAPNLFGESPLEIALIEAHHRHIEFELNSAIGAAWVNGPIVAKMGINEPIEAMRVKGENMTNTYYMRLNEELGQRAYIAGERFTIADITAVCMIDFASAMVNLKPDASLESLWRWHTDIHTRPSVQAFS